MVSAGDLVCGSFSTVQGQSVHHFCHVLDCQTACFDHIYIWIIIGRV